MRSQHRGKGETGANGEGCAGSLCGDVAIDYAQPQIQPGAAIVAQHSQGTGGLEPHQGTVSKFKGGSSIGRRDHGVVHLKRQARGGRQRRTEAVDLRTGAG